MELSLKDIILLARPHQYVKNLFIFLPAFFAFKLHQSELFVNASIAFCAFSLVASSVYVLNDWLDRFEDAGHPEKCQRPIAAGRVNFHTAIVVFFALLLGGMLLSVTISISVFYLICLYFILNIAYSLKLKHIPIIDIILIATGFVVRVFVGGEATHITLVNWIIIMTFLLALFLALGKRRDDVLFYLKTNNRTRRVVDGYNLVFLDASMVMTASIVILAYILWSISPEVTAKHESQYIYLTSIFVFLGVLRYMQIAFVEEKSGSPTKVLLKDLFVQCTLLFWIGSFVWILYL
jgi:4-hydroxybenzoate polyprenyltransferase